MTPPQGHPDQAQRDAKLLCLDAWSIEYQVPGTRYGIYILEIKPIQAEATAAAVLGIWGIGRHTDIPVGQMGTAAAEYLRM